MPRAEGTVYQRKDGRWVASLTHFDARGAKIRSSKYAKTKSEARAQLRQMRTRAEDSVAVTDSRDTLAAFLERWIETTLRASNRRASTQESYESLIRNHVLPMIGETRLRDLTPLIAEKWLLDVEAGVGRKRPISQNTRRRLFDALALALDTAVREQVIARNPLRQIDRPTATRTEVKTFSVAEVQALIEAAETHADARVRRFAPLVTFVAYTGARIGEALAVRWQDIDLAKREITIGATIVQSKREGLRRQEATKTSAGLRVIPIVEPVARALERQRVQQARERLAAGEAWANIDLVFTNTIGGIIDRRNADRPLTAIRKAAEIEAGMWHSFRHAAATTMIANGVPMAVVKEILGHSSIEVTIDLYFAGTTDMMREGMERSLAVYGS